MAIPCEYAVFNIRLHGIDGPESCADLQHQGRVNKRTACITTAAVAGFCQSNGEFACQTRSVSTANPSLTNRSMR